jgi:hypothetical protein
VADVHQQAADVCLDVSEQAELHGHVDAPIAI